MKSRRQKIVFFLVCSILCASLFILNVSAADEYSAHIYIRPESATTAYAAISSWQQDLTDPFGQYDVTPYSALNRPSTVYLEEYDGEYHNIYVSDGKSSYPYYVSYSFLDATFSKVVFEGPDIDTTYRLTGRIYMNFFNVMCNYYRFSIRAIVDGKPAGVIAYSDTYSGSTFSSGHRVELQANDLEFTWSTTNFPLEYDKLVLCVDTLVIPIQNDFSVFVYTDSDAYVKMGNAYQAPDYFWPNLQEPYDEFSDGLGDLMDSSAGGIESLKDLAANFPSRFASFALFIDRANHLLTHITGKIPYLDIVIFISMSLGLFSCLLGVVSGMVRAKESIDRSRDEAEKQRYQKWLIDHPTKRR